MVNVPYSKLVDICGCWKKLVNLKSDLNRNINHYSLEDLILLLVNRWMISSCNNIFEISSQFNE